MHFLGRLLVVEGECRSLSLLAMALSWLLLEVDGEWRSLALLEVDVASYDELMVVLSEHRLELVP